VKRKFRGYTLNIEVKNPKHISKGVKEIQIDGEKIEGSLIPLLEKGKTYTIKVIMG
jgi:cellobiose phosphorylase